MRTSLFACFVLLVTSCAHPESHENTQQDKIAAPKTDTVVMQINTPPEQTEMIPDTVRVAGDFNGDGSIDTAYGVVVQGVYEVNFSVQSMHALELGKGAIRLINEGDLNGDGRDELSVFQAPVRGCAYTMTTWTYYPTGWRRITDPWVIQTGCAYISDEDLQSRIVLEDGVVYYYQEDVNADDESLVKRELSLH